tara:strand:- start:47 stop:208 length:162 start_codon:yes stop_codon:yes gene_type:complete
MSNFTYEIYPTLNGSEYIKKTDANGNEWFIPTDPANSDYQEYLRSLKEVSKKA